MAMASEGVSMEACCCKKAERFGLAHNPTHHRPASHEKSSQSSTHEHHESLVRTNHVHGAQPYLPAEPCDRTEGPNPVGDCCSISIRAFSENVQARVHSELELSDHASHLLPREAHTGELIPVLAQAPPEYPPPELSPPSRHILFAIYLL